MLMAKARKLRSRLEEKDLLVGVGARDALEAKLIQQFGFDFVWSSSFAVSASYGVPDASLISMTQYLEAARAMNEVIDLPVIADCDTGYGNINNVIFAVKRFEESDIGGVCIEDKKFPKDTSLLAGGRQELVPVEEFTGKIMAAVDTRKNKDFVIIARVEALIAGRGQQEAAERALRYAEAGADCILVHSKSQTPDEILDFVKRWDGRVPLVLIPTTYPALTEEAVRELGKVKIVIYANQLIRAAVKAQERLLAEIKKAGGIHTIDEQMVPVDGIFELQGVPEMKENERKYCESQPSPSSQAETQL